MQVRLLGMMSRYKTAAYYLKDAVPDQVKQQRLEEIMALQQQISLEKNREKVGTEMKVIIDRKEGEYFIGRTEFDSPEVDNEVLLTSEKKIKTGQFHDAIIEKADFFDLYGHID